MKTAPLKSSRPDKARKAAAGSKSRKVTLGIKSILAPVDFSSASHKALAYAAALAEHFDAKLTLLYVHEPAASVGIDGFYPLMLGSDELVAAYKENLAKLVQKQLGDDSRVEKILIREGRAYFEIAETARALKSDVIVISTHGYSGLNHVLLGSVTERVVRHAPCPVLVVREHQHEFIRSKK
jgi:nucleotide-binding universal stress UspA family protein